jgi:hypothetical protein
LGDDEVLGEAMKEVKMKPCPFCGWNDARATWVWAGENRRLKIRVMCAGNNCYIGGPIRANKRSAIIAWNRRAKL